MPEPPTDGWYINPRLDAPGREQVPQIVVRNAMRFCFLAGGFQDFPALRNRENIAVKKAMSSFVEAGLDFNPAQKVTHRLQNRNMMPYVVLSWRYPYSALGVVYVLPVNANSLADAIT